MGNVLIYALCEPDTEAVRYVGATTQALKTRLAKHLYSSGKQTSPNAQWVYALQKSGRRPLIKLLETADTETWSEVERRWIAFYREQGVALNNVLIGGHHSYEGATELRSRLSEAASRHFADPENRARMVATVRNYYADPSNRAKHGTVMKNYYASEEHSQLRKQISESLKGIKRSAETRRKVSIARRARQQTIKDKGGAA